MISGSHFSGVRKEHHPSAIRGNVREPVVVVVGEDLLLLAAEGEAAEGLGDSKGAKKYWQQFLDVYDKQMSTGVEEYQAHQGVLEASRLPPPPHALASNALCIWAKLILSGRSPMCSA